MNTNSLLVLFSLLCLIITRSRCVLQNDSIPYWRESKARLKSHVLSHRVVREKLCPVDRNNTVQLSFYFYCYQVLMGEDVEQSFTSYNFLSITWTDPELTWNPEDYGGYSQTNIPYDDMWHPEVMVANSAEKDFMMVRPLNNHLLVNYDGLVKLHTPAYYKTTCALDLRFYPFDTQECEISFLPYTEDCNFEIYEANKTTISDPFDLQGEWTILSRDVWKTYYGSDYPNVKVKITMQRRSHFYVVTVLVPLVVTTAMTSFVFFIPPMSGERVSFLVTVFVSNAVFLNFIAGTMPRSFNFSNMPRLAIYLIGVIVESFFALLGTLFVLWKYNKEQLQVSKLDESKTKLDDCQLQSIRLEQKSSSDDLSTLTASVIGKLRSLQGNLPRKDKTDVDLLQHDREHLQVKRKRCFTVGECDLIFFILYHVLSIPFYLILFAFK